MDSCQYKVSVSKKDDTTFVTFIGEGLNSYGDSKLSGSDGFQQSLLKSLYRSLEDKRDIICQDYGTMLEECGGVKFKKRQSGVLFGTRGESKWEDGGEWKWYINDDDDRYGRYKGEIENGLPNGQGVGKTIDGHKYEGGWKDGKRHGEGTITYPIGDKYIGEFKDGKRHGQGSYTWTTGDKYEGEYKDGKEHGQGTYTTNDGDKFVGEFKDGKEVGQGTLYLTDGSKFVGEFKDGKYHGQGTHTLPDGSKYVGEWKDGKEWNVILYYKDGNILQKWVNGLGDKKEKGTLYGREVNGEWGWYKSGDEKKDMKYVGEIEDKKPNGKGTYIYSNGNRYVGEMKDGKRHGQGKLKYKDFVKFGLGYEGGWKDGKRHGEGTETYSDLSKYVGGWKDGKRHGEGTYTWSDGSKYVGEWKDYQRWNGTEYDKDGKIIEKFVNGESIKTIVVVEKKEIGVLYSGDIYDLLSRWSKNGDEKEDGKYVGEIKNGKPDGQGTFTWGNNKYVGEWKIGKRHGEGTYTYPSGGKFVGEYKYGKEWNGTYYDKNGNIKNDYVNGVEQ